MCGILTTQWKNIAKVGSYKREKGSAKGQVLNISRPLPLPPVFVYYKTQITHFFCNPEL